MTVQEFSNAGLNEYEKSVFLTKAQYEIVKAYFNPKSNKVQEGFDDSGKRQIDFSMITVKAELSKLIGEVIGDHFYNTTDKSSVRFSFPRDVMMVLNESLRVLRNGKQTYLVIVPITYNDYSRLMSKPYKYPIKNQAWRLMISTEDNIRYVELIAGPNDNLDSAKYSIRYLKRPHPIILDDLPDGLTIENYSGVMDCELDPEIHQEILQRCIRLFFCL